MVGQKRRALPQQEKEKQLFGILMAKNIKNQT